MIEIKNICKSFGNIKAIDNLSLTINDGDIIGLVGINGAGKSTLLRCISGVYQVDSGDILCDNENMYDNPHVKKNIFFLPDNPYYPNNSNVKTIIEFYKSFYDLNENKYYEIINKFKLDYNRSIDNYSKGMKRQLFIALALAIAPKYLLLDEAFDGLDPLARLIFRREINNLIIEKGITVIISSHSLRELEDICDKYALLDGGCIQNSGNIIENKMVYHKYQLAFSEDVNEEQFKNFNIVSFHKIGRVVTIVIKGEEDNYKESLMELKPLLIDEVKINFEEMFIIEVERKGYIDHEQSIS